MDILKWWTKHPGTIAIGQDNSTKTVNILLREPCELEPFPKEWKDYTINTRIENTQEKTPDFNELIF